MVVRIVAGSLLASLLVGAPAAAQNVAADVLIRSGAVAGHVVVRDGYSTYRRPTVIVERRRVARRVVVVERYAPRVIVVEPVHRHRSTRDWARHGYRPVTLYYVDGRYYDRWSDRWPRAYEVVVYERGGRYYVSDCEERWRHHDRSPERDWDD
jgi:hypothetical protein